MAMPPKPRALVWSEEILSRATKFWIKLRKDSLFALYSPFSLALASGSLEIEAFRNFIAQDFHFLLAFAQAYEMAVECADGDDDKLAITELRKGVNEKLKMLESFVQDWDSDLVKKCPMNPATSRYIEFLIEVASGNISGPTGLFFEKTSIAAYTINSMTPCMRLYAFLGKEFQALCEHNEGDHLYRKWIDRYSSDSFQTSALQTEELLDKLSVSFTAAELHILERLYHQAMKLEIEFFYAQPLAQPTVGPLTKVHNPAKDHLMIFCDFDRTCSLYDSSGILAEIAIATAEISEQTQPDARVSSAELKNTWNLIRRQYTDEYEQCIKEIMPSEKVEFSYEALYKALEQVSDCEKKANSSVIESGLLKGLNLEAIQGFGHRLVLRHGCKRFFQRIVNNKKLCANVHVISCCWCGDFVRAWFSLGDLHGVSVHANELKFEGTFCTGGMDRKVESPIDKVRAFNGILKGYTAEGDRKNLTVYIGGTVGDLLCLLEADIGIVIECSSRLRRLGSQFGVSFVPLFPGLVKKQKECVEGSSNCWKGRSGTVYTVSNWHEIRAFILGWSKEEENAGKTRFSIGVGKRGEGTKWTRLDLLLRPTS